MKTAKSTPIIREAVRSIASVTAKENNGKIPARSIAAQLDAAAQRHIAGQGGKSR